MKILNPYTIPLQSINLIEASAGTGKSWTVSLLVLRLILEKELSLNQILVVTFTDAATKELRDAVRNRLIEALDYFKNPSDNPQQKEYQILYKSLITENKLNNDDAILYLKRAKLSIDEASIFTIHSFCQRSLVENAFEAGLPFDSELIDDDSALLQQLTDDFWRANFQTAPPALIFKLQQRKITPELLLKDIRSAVAKPYLERKGPILTQSKSQQWQDLELLFNRAKETWLAESDEIMQQLIDHGGLNKRAYSEVKIINLCKSLCACSSSLSVLLSSSVSFENLGSSKLSNNTNKGFETPSHSFFHQWQRFLDCLTTLNEDADSYIWQIRVDLLTYLQKKSPKEKRRTGVLSYDDLLLQLHEALNKHKDFASELRNKYKVALIDEFQDTDPVQYEIFNAIYNANAIGDDNALFLVGDPKQAIYSFRGGDIHTYLKAKRNTPIENHYTLNVNYRSHPKLITAYNALYQQSDRPFQAHGIDYVNVESGKKKLCKIQTQAPRTALQFWQCLQEKGENKGALRDKIAKSIAGDIATLLNEKALIEKKEITGGDIAILVRTHDQGHLIKAALAKRNIASVQSGKDSIFETHEAGELLSVLNAIVEPQQEDAVRQALVTDILGYQSDDLIDFETNSTAWEDKLTQVHQWHHQWKQKGFMPMFKNLLTAEKVHQRLLRFNDGERRLTNLFHLLELVHHATKKQALSMEEVLRWLKQGQDSTDKKETELRLESDENLVKIVTIHKSKGLEYPVVYCPFVGLSGKPFSDKVYSFHQENNSYLEIGSSEHEIHKALKIEEEMAESTRLLYVALTRAKYQCIVVCFPQAISRNRDTALGWLLSKGKLVKEKQIFYDAYEQNLESLSSKFNNEISMQDLPLFDDGLHYQPAENSSTLKARVFSTTLKEQAQITSFSGLTADSHAETPDHDTQHSSKVLPDLLESEFPRGATAGSALHEVYENLDFTQTVQDQADVVLAGLSKWGFNNEQLEPAKQLIERSLNTTLFKGFTLSQLSQENRLNEMEFYLPLERLKIKDLQQVLFQYLPQGGDWQVIRDAVASLRFDQVKGYLKGFIDLIFVHQSKYYVVDYKSNSLTDYKAASLLPVMADSHYYLQYLLYSVALHRYLKKRLLDYSWESDIGGAYYLFIRGMSSTTGAGIFYHKPDYALIDALDKLFVKQVDYA